MNRLTIFSNLIKSIQAIPQTRQGLIEVELKIMGDKVLVVVADNGDGYLKYLWQDVHAEFHHKVLRHRT